jgi:peptidoglycan hydrolase-like protein with peptidoglycan-binding domain
MKTRDAMLLLLVVWCQAAALGQAPQKPAAGPVTTVQSALKGQHFYFGEITGTLDDETRAALRRYQIHRGLRVTGEPDTETLKKLGDTAPDRDNGSVRALAQETAQDDHALLQHLDEEAPSTKPLPEASVEHQPAPREKSEREPPVRASEPEPGGAVPISPKEAEAFIRAYLEAAEQPEPAQELSFYADNVNYFDGGRVNRKFVEKDQRNYYRRWPTRNFTLLGEPELLRNSGDTAALRFRIRYSVHGPEGKAQGSTENVIQLRRTDRGLKIAAIQERKL